MQEYSDFWGKIKDFQPLLIFSFGILGYFIKRRIETTKQRKSVASALLAEINALKVQYKKVELTDWNKQQYINIQSLEEDYTITYNNLCDKISLFSLQDAKTIITFYTCLKAHIDTLRVLAFEQKQYYYLFAGISILGNRGNSQKIMEDSLDSFKSTHMYALFSQMELYKEMDKVEIVLKNQLKISWICLMAISIMHKVNMKRKYIN